MPEPWQNRCGNVNAEDGAQHLWAEMFGTSIFGHRPVPLW